MSTIAGRNEIAVEPVTSWTVAEAKDLYEIERWGKGYFSIGDEGHVRVHPTKQRERSIDLKRLVDSLIARGIAPPLLLRFAGILEHRMAEIRGAFGRAIAEHGFTGAYICAYPVKVNQQRQVVEEVVRFGQKYEFGLEVGSKPELLAVIAVATNETPIVCNGFKDAEFIETAMLAQRLGRRVMPVVERFDELELILKYAEKSGVRPQLGMRVKLAARSSGRWQASGGYRSKFGLSVSEIRRGLALLKERGMEDCFGLLHFHLGSQITNIRHVKEALNEAARLYVDLVRSGAKLGYLDVGGGLGVDYDGSQTNFESSVNYTLEEYANDVVFHIQRVCDEAGVAHPTIISESGRAVAAYHSVLVFNVLGVSGRAEEEHLPSVREDRSKPPLDDLWDTYESLSVRNALEGFHDAQQALDMAVNLFNGGHLTLDERGEAETLFWSICRKLRRLVRKMDYVPEELQDLDSLLADVYFCNFSLFQSIPDSWAVKQLFPLMPLHRLDERPTRHAVLGDITCDSDGKIDQFIDLRDVKRTLPLHPFNGEPYFLAAFLVGAYQEILGDLHNLFGDTNVVHVGVGEDEDGVLEAVIEGDTVREVLEYVEFDVDSLIRKLSADIEDAVRRGNIAPDQAGRLLRFYKDQLRGYTYLEDTRE